jgi:CheY-like chemotaxis protein
MSDQRITVLVIDRPADFRHVEHCGFETLEAEGTRAAMAALAERPDVALLFSDVLLSRMSGDQLADYLGRLSSRVIVLLNAAGGVAKMDQLLAAKPKRRHWLGSFRRAVRAAWRRLFGRRRAAPRKHGAARPATA